MLWGGGREKIRSFLLRRSEEMVGVGWKAGAQCGTEFLSFLSRFFLWPHSLINQASALLGISFVLLFCPPTPPPPNSKAF